MEYFDHLVRMTRSWLSVVAVVSLGCDRDAAFRSLDSIHLERRPIPLNQRVEFVYEQPREIRAEFPKQSLPLRASRDPTPKPREPVTKARS
jgi:hypothetical protein